MGKKLDEAYYKLLNEAEHHTRLAFAKQTEFENGFAQGFTEAVRIVRAIREGRK
jgi:hypothetical protein